MERSFLDYAMSVIMPRALPDVRDGLKPVHRRILWGMHDLGARPDRPHMKCARVTGDVMGKYHPHGDGAIYDALVRMAQDFSPAPPARRRPRQLRLARLRPGRRALHRVPAGPAGHAHARRHRRGHRRLQRQLLGRVPGARVLPARFPNLLVNGSQGIAVGMATNIPPHNLGEVIDATVHLIDNPEATPDDLMQFVKGPDFPTGALSWAAQGILDAYRTGKGSIRLRAVCRDRGGHGRGGDQIVVTELPYQVGPERGRSPRSGAGRRRASSRASPTSTTSRPAARPALVIKLKKDAPALVILNNLYKHTPLQTNFAVNTVALVDGVPRTLNLVQALQAYIDHQVEVIRRRSEFRLDKAAGPGPHRRGPAQGRRRHRRRSSPPSGPPTTGPAARDGAHGRAVRVHRVQAEHILDMQLGRLTRLGRADLEEEMAELRETIAELEAILGDEAVLPHGHQGRAGRGQGEVRRRAPLARSPSTPATWTSRTSSTTRSSSSRCRPRATSRPSPPTRSGPRAAAAAAWPAPSSRDEDYVSHILTTTAHAYLLFFSNLGRVYRLKAHEIPMKERTARGTAIVEPAAAAARRAHPGDHRHPRLRDQPVPVLRHQEGPGEEDEVQRVRLVAAHRASSPSTCATATSW